MKVAVRQIRGNSGIDVWAENLCQGLHRQGHECSLDLISPVFEPVPALAGFFSPTEEPDIVHGNSWNGFAFKKDCPLVVTEHHVVHDPAYDPYRTVPQKVYHRWIKRCEQQSLDTADAVTCDCEYTRRKLEEIFGFCNSYLVYVGIDNTLFSPREILRSAWNLPEKTTLLFFAGNLSHRKGADLLPPIMKALGDDYLLLVSSGQSPGSISGCRNILNLGRLDVTKLVDIYNLCDIFLTASRLEGFGLSVAEAMACGKPVVATNTSSLPELVVDGKGGLLCRMDDIHDFADKIRYLSADDNVRRDMGIFNRRRIAESFTIEQMTKGYLDIYQSVMKER